MKVVSAYQFTKCKNHQGATEGRRLTNKKTPTKPSKKIGAGSNNNATNTGSTNEDMPSPKNSPRKNDKALETKRTKSTNHPRKSKKELRFCS